MKVQITVDEQLWRKARVAALERGETLGELVGVALGDLLYVMGGGKREKQGGALGQVATEKGGSTPPLPTKPVNVVTGSGKYGKPLEDEPIATMKCWVCKDKVTKWTLDVKGHAWCDSCIQDQKNAIA